MTDKQPSKEQELILKITDYYNKQELKNEPLDFNAMEEWLKEYAKEQWFFTEVKDRGYDYGKTVIHLDPMKAFSVPQAFDLLKNPAGTFYDHKRDEGYFGGYLIYRGGDKTWATIKQ